MLAYALTIFTGAFLLFQVQPLIGKYILPWFGGSPGVWTTCMLFFQVLLVGGYAYAHFTTQRLRPRAQVILHVTLLLVAITLLPIIPSEGWKPAGGAEPIGRILLLLATTLGLPYFMLSTTGPLMQEWFRQTHPGVSPYRLYALSNVGSLLALVSYPFLFEPNFTRRQQALMWSAGLVVFVLLCAWCARLAWKHAAPANETKPASEANPTTSGAGEQIPSPSGASQLLWVLLPACASVLLVATTNKLCQDVAVIPFLWVLPLAIYLVTFILCFDHPRWYARPLFTVLFILCASYEVWALFEGVGVRIHKQVLIYAGTLFTACMICHGELYRLKPHPKHLTRYFLMISIGGALGGFFVAVVAPLAFNSFLELHIGLWACAALLFVAILRDERGSYPWHWRWLSIVLGIALLYGMDRFLGLFLAPRLAAMFKSAETKSLAGALTLERLEHLHWAPWIALALWAAVAAWRKTISRERDWHEMACACLVTGVVALASTLAIQVRVADKDAVYWARNFYGTLTIFEYRREEPTAHYFLLQHGKITHGLQFKDAEFAKWPTTYYGAGSGVSLAWNAFPTNQPRHLGVVGLGTGTLASFGRPGDSVRFYDINPAVTNIAQTRFTYVPNCEGRVTIVLGDARLSMEEELKRGESQQFDVLALDAFSSDAIPVHLLTREALEIYFKHLKPGGVLAVHISNRYLDLEPVVEGLSKHFNVGQALISDNGEEDWWLYTSSWVLVTRDKEFLLKPSIAAATSASESRKKNVPLWTDDFASLFQILQR